MKNALFPIVILLVVIVGGFYVFNSYIYNEKQAESGLSTAQQRTLVTVHINENISQLSPVKEVLGGTFYVTDITFLDERRGIVQYEDGHIALEADFTYTVSDDADVTVRLANVREAQM
jgi:hypothetical protein